LKPIVTRTFLLLFFLMTSVDQGVLASASSDTLSTNISHAALRAAIIHSPTDYHSGNVTGLRAEERNVALAFGASAILPGAGQYYNKQKVKAIVAISLEAAAITGYSVMRSRGNSAEEDFQNVAHNSWSPARYATWLNDYTQYLTDEFGATVTAPPVTIASGINFQNPSDWSSSQSQDVHRMIDEITAVERQLFHPETGAAFSHQLPDFSVQQYYELIGKYFQFAPGWEDYPAWKDAEGNFLVAIDPEHTGIDGSKPNVSDSFYRYAREHADAQDMLRRASQISLLFVFNHLIAGIDAAVNAKLHNDRLDTSLGLAYDPAGRPAAVTRLTFSF